MGIQCNTFTLDHTLIRKINCAPKCSVGRLSHLTAFTLTVKTRRTPGLNSVMPGPNGGLPLSRGGQLDTQRPSYWYRIGGSGEFARCVRVVLNSSHYGHTPSMCWGSHLTAEAQLSPRQELATTMVHVSTGFRIAFSGLHLCRHQGGGGCHDHKLASGEEVAAALKPPCNPGSFGDWIRPV
jgi:hypothetical protein